MSATFYHTVVHCAFFRKHDEQFTCYAEVCVNGHGYFCDESRIECELGVYFSAIMMYLEQVKCREQNMLATFHSLKVRYHLVILRTSSSETHKTRLKYIFIVHDNYASVLIDLIRRKYQGHAFRKMLNSNELAQICIL